MKSHCDSNRQAVPSTMRRRSLSRRLIGLAAVLGLAIVAPVVRAEAVTAANCSFISTVAYGPGAAAPAGACSTGISPATDTPDGYHLPSGTKSTYTFTSDTYYAYVVENGSVTSRVEENFVENVLSDFNEWSLTIKNRRDFGQTFESWWYYECGVNISGASDPTCSTWSGNTGASGPDSGQINAAGTGYGTKYIYKNYGSKIGRKFPMVRDRIQWADGTINVDVYGRWGWHIRGWDTCDPTLCTTTGDGN